MNAVRFSIAIALAGCVEHIELSHAVDGGPQSDSGTRACGVTAEPCAESADCCSFLCTGGFCAASPNCSVAGETCSAAAECCSGACARGRGGRVECQALGGCRPAGEICQADADCCDDASGAGACVVFDATTGVGRCRAPTSCAQAGERCTSGGLACCPLGASIELCQTSEVAGISRCVSEEAGTTCLPADARCASPPDCCSHACAPNDTGMLTCAAECTQEGRSCTRDADCCSASCERRLCRPGSAVCVPFGAPCASSEECCSGFCGAGETCSSPLI